MTSTQTWAKRGTAFAATLSLAVGSLLLPQAQSAEAATDPVLATEGYLESVYENLTPGHVFEVASFERFEYLLGKPGTFGFLVGSPDEAHIQRAIGEIDEIARDHNVGTIYLFNPKLVGDNADVRDFVRNGWQTADLETQLEGLYTRVVTEKLNKDTTPEFGNGTADPYFFVYNRDRTVTVEGAPVEDRIIASLTDRLSAEEAADADQLGAFRAEVEAVFAAAGAAGASSFDTIDHFTFLTGEYNRRHKSAYPNAATHGGDIFDTETAADFVVHQLTYPELVYLLNQPGEHVILFGGTWCHNTRAVVKHINQYARSYGTPVIYNFDLRLDGTSGNQLHIRDSNSGLAHYYGDLVSEYFPNLKTQYVTDGTASQRVDYWPNGVATGSKTAAKKLQVPFLIEYDKDATTGGEPTPVVRQWIQDNGTSFKEYMTEWWYVLGLRGSANQDSPAHVNGVAFAKEAIEKAEAFFAGIHDDAAESTELSLEAAGLQGRAALTATVLVNDATATGAQGKVEFFRDVEGEPVSVGKASVVNGVATLTPRSPQGEQSFTATFLRSPGSGLKPSAAGAVQATVEAPPVPIESDLDITTTVTSSKATFTVTLKVDDEVDTLAEGTVTVQRPGGEALGSAPVVDGVAVIEVTGLSVGSHAYEVVFTPADDLFYNAVTSEEGTITVPLPSNAKLTIAPAINGTLKVGQTLSYTLNPNYEGATATQQWLRNGTAIKGATKATYKLTSSDRGKQISVKVTAKRTGIAKSVTKTSAKTAKIDYGTLAISTADGARTEPTATGDSVVGAKLTAVVPDYQGFAKKDLTFSYQWLRDGVAIKGATKSTYTITAADLGKELRIRVTAKKSGYTSLTTEGVCCANVTAGLLISTAAPKISGTAKVGKTLKVSGAKWNTSGVTVRYEWYAALPGGEPVLVQRGSSTSFKLSWLEKGAVITVKAVGAKNGWAGAINSGVTEPVTSSASNATAVVK